MDCVTCTGCSRRIRASQHARRLPLAIDELRFNNVTGAREQRSGLRERCKFARIPPPPPPINFNGGNTMQGRPLLVAPLA